MDTLLHVSEGFFDFLGIEGSVILYWLANNQESRFSESEVHKYVDRYVQNAIKAGQEGKLQADPERSSQYILLRALTTATQDPIELRNQVLTLLLAGRDATASLLNWTVLLLARHADEFQKLRQAVLEGFGPYDNPRNLTFGALKSCSRLRHCLNESLRLYPVAPFNRRIAVRDTTLPRGAGSDGRQPIFVWPMGGPQDIVGVSSFQWGAKDMPRTAVRPDGGGICLVRSVQRFDAMEDANAEEEIKQKMALTSAPAQSVTVRLHAPRA
ncbi:hypothetical protein HFD88_003521 [Aspergillus terreus]|nr:hypothetical protein HFD88_003521 [Aspergillus terreus]